MANPGTSIYPQSLDDFTAVTTGVTYEDDSGFAHTVLHNQSQDADEKIQSVIGTTLGTSVLKNFAAGQFPVRNTGGAATGTLVQTLVGGTANSITLGTPTFSAGAVNTADIADAAVTSRKVKIDLAQGTANTQDTSIAGATWGTLLVGTLTPNVASNALVIISASLYNVATVQAGLAIALNGTNQRSISQEFNSGITDYQSTSFSHWLTGLGTAAGTISARWNVGAGAGTLHSIESELIIIPFSS